MNTTQQVPLNQIDIPESFRQHTQESVADLAQDITRQGQLQEIIVTPKEGGSCLPTGRRYELVAGKRRTLALRQLNWDNARAIVMENLSELQKALIMIAENDKRVDTSPFDRALSYDRAIKAGSDQQTLADSLGLSKQTVSGTLALLNFAPEIAAEYRRRDFTAGQLQELVRLPNVESQRKMGKVCDEEGWSVRKLREQVNRVLAETATPAEHAAQKQKPTAHQFAWKGRTLDLKPLRFDPATEAVDDYVLSLHTALTDYLAHHPLAAKATEPSGTPEGAIA